MTTEQWLKLTLPILGALAVAALAGLDLDRRRRKRSNLSAELDLLDRLREAPELAPAAEELARSIGMRVLALCAEEEPYTPTEQRLRNSALNVMIGGYLIPVAIFSLSSNDTTNQLLPLWVRIIALTCFVVGGLTLLATALRRGGRRRRMIGRVT